MTRQCELSGKMPLRGMNVSHSHIRTHRRFLPNLQSMTLFSKTLGQTLRVRASVHALRSLEHKGGLDEYLLQTRPEHLSLRLQKARRLIRKKQQQTSSA